MNLEPLDDLLEKMRTGDVKAAETIFIKYQTELRLIVRRKLSRSLRTKFDSLDVVQSVWVHILKDFGERMGGIEDSTHLRNFLVQVTRNCLIDRLRHYRTSLIHERSLFEDEVIPGLSSNQPRPSELVRADELWDTLLANSQPEHHELLRLKRQGLGLEAIASRTGFHQDSIRRIIRRLARKYALSNAT